MRKSGKIMIAVVLGLSATTVPALADRIDGDWCSGDGKHLKIDGPRIMIPSGAEISGQYDRHHFHYAGPAGDPEAGQSIDMQVLSDEEMWLQRTMDGETKPVETWRRCQVTS
jgi:hypothetical protein